MTDRRELLLRRGVTVLAVAVLVVAGVVGVDRTVCRLELMRDSLVADPDVLGTGASLDAFGASLPGCVAVDVVGDGESPDAVVLDVQFTSRAAVTVLAGPERFLSRAALPIPPPPPNPGGPQELAPSSMGSCTPTECVVIAYDGAAPEPDCVALEIPDGSVPVYRCPSQPLPPEVSATPLPMAPPPLIPPDAPTPTPPS